MKLSKSFYLREDVTQIARELLGKVLFTKIGSQRTAGKIVETEAYSYKERACHAFGQKRTARTETLFMEGGTSYVYLCYGIHKLFNVVTNHEGWAEAVLIRAVEPLEGEQLMVARRGSISGYNLTSGPGKLSQALGINLTFNKQSLMESQIWIEDNGLHVNKIITSPRIGVGYAGEDAKLNWRYSESGNFYVSKGNNTYK